MEQANIGAELKGKGKGKGKKLVEATDGERVDESSHERSQQRVAIIQGITSGGGSRHIKRQDRDHESRLTVYDNPIPHPLLAPRKQQDSSSSSDGPPTRRFKPRRPSPRATATPTVGAQSVPTEGVLFGKAAAWAPEGTAPSSHQERLAGTREGVLPPAKGGGGGSGGGGRSSSCGGVAFRARVVKKRSLSRSSSTRGGGSRPRGTVDKDIGSASTTPSSNNARNAGRWSNKGYKGRDGAVYQSPPASEPPAHQQQHQALEETQHQEAVADGSPPTSGSDAPTEETKRTVLPCPEAILIVLQQAVVSGGKWYTSANQLALASLGCCMACRKLPVMRVRVDDGTPKWLLKEEVDASKKYERMYIQNNWVPPMSSFALWEVLWRAPIGSVSLMTEIFERVERLTVNDKGSYSYDEVKLPPKLKVLRLCGKFNGTLRKISFPEGLQELDFRTGKFNQSLTPAKWPKSLVRLDLGDLFNRPTKGAALPPCLQYLSFGRRFDRDISNISWPPSLRELTFGHHFQQPIAGISWPPSLVKVTFGFYFDQPLDRVSWPGLVELTLGYYFNQRITDVVWPARLKKISFGGMFTQEIDRGSLPSSLAYLTLRQPGAQLPVLPGVEVSGVPDDFVD
eukprot:g1352.t1